MSPTIYAAGALCWRLIDGKLKVLVIHRPKYGDITLPKGKVDAGESLPETAVREVKEETGLNVDLGVPLSPVEYRLANGREKVVHYWAAEVFESELNSSTFVPGKEVDGLDWVGLNKARKLLSYQHDIALVDEFEQLVDEGVYETFALITLRHGKAQSLSSWGGTDATRPLSERGRLQASSSIGGLRAFGIQKILSSTAKRCLETVRPLANELGLQIKTLEGLSQGAYEAGESSVREVAGKRVRRRKTTLICSHGPVIPELIREIAYATGTPLGSYVRDAGALETASYTVIHLSKSNPGSGIISLETHVSRA